MFIVLLIACVLMMVLSFIGFVIRFVGDCIFDIGEVATFLFALAVLIYIV